MISLADQSQPRGYPSLSVRIRKSYKNREVHVGVRPALRRARMGVPPRGRVLPRRGYVSGRTPTQIYNSGIRGMTIAERARESMFSRLMDALSQIIAIEEGMYTDESQDGNTLSVFPKDSVDLKNICLRLAENDSRNSPSDRDLRDLQGCLKCIAENLLSVCNENDAAGLFVSRKLKDICDTFPEMW